MVALGWTAGSDDPFPDTTVRSVWVLEVLWDISWLISCSVSWGEALPDPWRVFHGTGSVPGTAGLSLGLSCGSDSITDDVFQENFQHL